MADSEKEVAAATAAVSVPAQSQVDTAAAATSPAHRAQSSSRQQHEKSPSLNASAPSFNPGKAKGRAPPRAPSVASSQGQPRPPSAASTSSRSQQQQQQQRQQTQQSFRSRPAVPIEPRGYIPPAVQTTRKSDVDVDARIVAARLKAEEARKKFEAAEAERIAYEQQVQQEQKTALDKAERDRKLAEDMSAHREAARQKKLRAMTETTGSESGKGAGVSEE